jgi:hypothetical protein
MEMQNMKSFKDFVSEDGGGAAATGPANATGGIAGARPGDLPPVSQGLQKKYQKRGAASEKGLVKSLRKVTGTVRV